MRTLKRLVARIWNFSAGRRGDARLREEIEAHIAMQAEDNMRSGMPPAEARRQAVLKLGAIETIREQYLAEEGLPILEHLLNDVRYALRQLRKSPGFTTTAVLTLALGIGANAVVFSVLNALVLRPLNLPKEKSLYGIDHNGIGFESYPNYRDMRERNRSFEDLAAYNIVAAGVDADHDVAMVWGFEATGNYFDALGIQPYTGRFFHESDEHGPNSVPYLVLGYNYWHVHFQDDRSVIGR